MKILLVVLALILAFIAYLVINTIKVGSKKTYYNLSDDEKRVDEYANKLSKLVQVETESSDTDPQLKKFRNFHKTLEKQFPAVFKTCEKIDIDANLMMKWPGRNPKLAPIILISHMDVVPAEGIWKYPPYKGVIAEGKVWGRGACDIKGGLFSFYQAAEELIKQGYVPECDVYLGSSCTEEIGGTGAPKMANYFKEKGIKLWMLCDEGGCIVQDPVPGAKGHFAAIGLFEKGYGDLKIKAMGNGGHSSTPPKNTPIVRLAKFETAIEKKNPFKVKFTPAVINMFKQLAPYCEDFKMKLVMANVSLLQPILCKAMPIISPEASAMLQTTIAFTTQKGSNAYNVIPQEAYVTANLRYIPFQDAHDSNKIVMDIAKKYDLEVETICASDASKAVDINSEQFNMVKKTVNKIFPGIGIMPYVVTGGTDSRFFNDVCDNCVRFTPLNYGPEQLKGMHGIDENIESGCLPMAVDYFKEIIKAQEERD